MNKERSEGSSQNQRKNKQMEIMTLRETAKGGVGAPAAGGASTILIPHCLKITGPTIHPYIQGRDEKSNKTIPYPRPYKSVYLAQKSHALSVL